MQAKVRGGSPGETSETTGVGFVKEVGFKPGVKERHSLRYRTVLIFMIVALVLF